MGIVKGRAPPNLSTHWTGTVTVTVMRQLDAAAAAVEVLQTVLPVVPPLSCCGSAHDEVSSIHVLSVQGCAATICVRVSVQVLLKSQLQPNSI